MHHERTSTTLPQGSRDRMCPTPTGVRIASDHRETKADHSALIMQPSARQRVREGARARDTVEALTPMVPAISS